MDVFKTDLYNIQFTYKFEGQIFLNSKQSFLISNFTYKFEEPLFRNTKFWIFLQIWSTELSRF